MRPDRSRWPGLDGAWFCRMDPDSRFELDRYALHPHNSAVHFNHGPTGAGCSVDLHPLQHLLHFAGTAGVAETNTVTGSPGAQDRGGGTLSLNLKLKSKARHLDFTRNLKGNLSSGPAGSSGRFDGKAKLTVGPFPLEAIGQLCPLPRLSCQGKRAQCFGGPKIWRKPKLFCGIAEHAPL